MVEESALLDLKHLLMEAQQRVPPVLMALEDPAGEMDEVGALPRPFGLLGTAPIQQKSLHFFQFLFLNFNKKST